MFGGMGYSAVKEEADVYVHGVCVTIEGIFLILRKEYTECRGEEGEEKKGKRGGLIFCFFDFFFWGGGKKIF